MEQIISLNEALDTPTFYGVNNHNTAPGGARSGARISGEGLWL